MGKLKNLVERATGLCTTQIGLRLAISDDGGQSPQLIAFKETGF